MSELRQRLADRLKGGLAKHGYPMANDTANYLASLLLSTPGIAIVELPEPNDDHHDGIAFWWDAAEVGCDRGMVVTTFDPGSEAIYFAPDVARNIAAALLAAAVKAGGAAE